MEIEATLRDLVKNNPAITYEQAKVSLKQLVNPKLKEVEMENSFFEYFDMFVQSKKGEVRVSTAKRYDVLKNHLIAFEKKMNYPLSFDKICYEFFDKFRTYSFEICKHSNNYLRMLVKNFKVFLNWVEIRGYYKFTFYKNFKISEVPIEFEYLTQ